MSMEHEIWTGDGFVHAAYLQIKSRSPVEMGKKYIQSSSDDWNVALNESFRSIKMSTNRQEEKETRLRVSNHPTNQKMCLN